MIPTTYTAQVLADLCRPESIDEFFEERYEIKADGLWVRDAQPGALVANRDIAEWHPRRDRELPALPFPFTSRDLAVFMLAGYGGGLLEKFQSGPRGIRHKDALAELGPNADKAREVWTDAYKLLIKAVRQFGRDDNGVRMSAEWLLSSVPLADAAAGATAESSLPILQETGMVRHHIGKTLGHDVMTPLIGKAQAASSDPLDVAEVWAAMCAMADLRPPPAPLIGRDDESLKYRSGGADVVELFTRKKLGQRLKRMAEKARKRP